MRIFIVLIFLGFFLGSTPGLHAQSSIWVRNNSWIDFQVSTLQSGSHVLAPNEWSQKASRQEPWWVDQELLETDRDSSAIPNGDTVLFSVDLTYGPDVLNLRFRLIGNGNGSSLEYAASGPGFSGNWNSDGNFHQHSTVVDGRNITLKFRPMNNDNGQSRDLLFVVHEDVPYRIDTADFANPNVINVMAYNIQMLPLGISGLPDADLRGDLMPGILDPSQDVVIFAEVFDPGPRNNNLKPAMKAQGFDHNSGILNDYFPFNGGVIIYSKWPIEKTDEYDFALCGPNSADCFANKGIMYARINKLGKKYHILGTHMDAGSAPADLEAKNLQMAEMRDFIAAQNIPDNEAVLYGGDFNVSPISGNNLYANMLDSLDPVVPYHIGYHCSTMNTDTAKIIDHIWGCRKHLVPLQATNKIMSLRSIDDDMWDLSEFSDHRSVIARYTYPDISHQGGDTVICPGDDITFSVNSSIPVGFSWQKNGTPINGALSATYTLGNTTSSDDGAYKSNAQYEVVYGDSNDFLTPFFFPNGPDSVRADIDLEFGQLTVDAVLCAIGFEEDLSTKLKVWPNPADEKVLLEIKESISGGSIELCSMQGRILKSWEIRKGIMELDISEFASGLYLIKISSDHKTALTRFMIR